VRQNGGQRLKQRGRRKGNGREPPPQRWIRPSLAAKIIKLFMQLHLNIFNILLHWVNFKCSTEFML
jgi:hypothetical protein